jgi:hypothetical protein
MRPQGPKIPGGCLVAKYGTVLHDREPGARQRMPAGRMLILVILLAVSPILYEEGSVLNSRWRAMLGYSYQTPETPCINKIREAWRELSTDIGRQTTSAMHFGGWSPITAVPAAVVLAGLGGLLLRKGH